LACYQDGRGERCLLEAMSLLARLLDAAQAGGRMGNVIEILVVQALARHAHGDLPAALASLQQALALAEPEGYVRLFVDEGPPMARLMHAAAARGILPVYMAKLLSAFGPELLPHSGRSSLPASPAAQSLVEPLSERELEVLRLFQTELSGPDIAQELVIALSTVRTHTKGIYSKLGVSSRRAAVKRAEDLHLL